MQRFHILMQHVASCERAFSVLTVKNARLVGRNIKNSLLSPTAVAKNPHHG